MTGIPIGIPSSAVGLKTCAVTGGIKKYWLVKYHRSFNFQDLN